MDVIPDFAEMTSRDVVELAKDLGRRNANARLLLPHKLIRNIKALCFWARERTLMNMTLDPDLFTAASLAKAKQDLAMREDTTDAAPPLQMEKFKASDWPRWSRDFVTYLSHHNGVVQRRRCCSLRAHKSNPHIGWFRNTTAVCVAILD